MGDGIDAILDQYDLALGDRLPQFMEQQIAKADYVLIICTPVYKEKADERRGGVGYEEHIISGELLSKNNDRKFIPVIRKGSNSTAVPVCLLGKRSVNLTEGNEYEDNYSDLVTTILGNKKKPPIGESPKYVSKQNTDQLSEQKPNQKDDPVHILGIITDEVTVPKMDGTRGSALYQIPFRLSKIPSPLWADLFVKLWDCPPSFTTMHRPGIASVIGDRIVLNGTCIEEVRNYHRDTLVLCVDEANKQEARILDEEQKRMEQQNRFIQEHKAEVSSIAGEMKF